MGSSEHLIGNNCDLTQSLSTAFNVLGDIVVKIKLSQAQRGTGAL